MERGTEQAKKESKEQVPGDRVKDAAALARELRWRVKHAAGHTSDDEDSNRNKKVKNASATHAVNGAKRRRLGSDAGDEESGGHYKNFRPKAWERVLEKPAEKESKVIKVPKADVSEEVWTDWRDSWEDMEMDGGEEVVVDRQRDVIIKVRRTTKGLERQRIERVLEDWVWSSESSSSSASSSMSAVSSLSPPAPAIIASESVNSKMDVDADGVVNGEQASGPEPVAITSEDSSGNAVVA